LIISTLGKNIDFKAREVLGYIRDFS
jgi:hypothetical protein